MAGILVRVANLLIVQENVIKQIKYCLKIEICFKHFLEIYLFLGVPMIHYAVYTSNLDAVQFLCRHRVDVNKRTTEVHIFVDLFQFEIFILQLNKL